jgi:hypothetical protein
MSDVVMPAGDGTHRVIESDAIRALVGYLAADECGGCCCHLSPPCLHCTEHYDPDTETSTCGADR